MELILFLPLLISFFATFFILPKWIEKAKNVGLIWEDMNKFGKPKNVAGSGGLIVILGFILGILIYISLKTFYFESSENVVEIFALTTSILLLAGIGLIDDLLGWWHGGLNKKIRLFLGVFAAVPMMVINVGNPNITIPLSAWLNIGLIYPLIIIPVGIVGASNAFNFLAGFNGLESSQGILILSALSAIALLTGNSWLALVGLCMVFSLIGFWIFNKVPAKTFPGDILTYSVGGLIAIMAILGDMERVAIFFFIPYIIEVILKIRGGLDFKRYSFGKPNKDNSLEMPYGKIYGLTHFSIWFLKKIKKKVYERDVVMFINLIQIVIIVLGFIIFRNGIFKI